MCSAICNEFDYRCDLIVFIALRWVFKQLYDRGMVYRGYKVMPYSTACSTPLSNFEAGQNYKDVIDPASECVGTGGEGRGGEGRGGRWEKLSNSEVCLLWLSVSNQILWSSSCVNAVIVNFPLEEDPSVSLIAWTTTPWTLPSNLALCVHPEFTYVKVKGQQHCTWWDHRAVT